MELEFSLNGNMEDNVEGCEFLGDLSEMKPALGDLMWVKLSDGTWWPTIVVDENNVSEGDKPIYKSKGDVLVRLYGSYKYLYVDYIQCYSELQVLKQSNDSYLEILKKAMEQYLLSETSGASKKRSLKSRGALDGRVSRYESKNVNRNHQGRGILQNNGKELHKASRQNGAKKKLKLDTPKKHDASTRHEYDTPSSDRITRRLKVMQTLGLSAPSGSPFLRNGRTS